MENWKKLEKIENLIIIQTIWMYNVDNEIVIMCISWYIAKELAVILIRFRLIEFKTISRR